MTVVATPDGVVGEHVVVALAGSARDAARLSFDNGIGRLDLRAGPELTGLLDARFAEHPPVVWAAGNNVHVEYPLGSRLLHRTRRASMRVNPSVSWTVDVHGGADHVYADLTGVDVQSIAFHSGAAHVRLVLDHPTGPRTIRLASVKDVRIDRPPGVAVRLDVAKGATDIAVDGQRFGAVGGGLSQQTPGYHTAAARYLIIVSGGADTLTVGQAARRN
ncbi:MAG TPA: hypothetical protein VFR67_06490 [Pilimelia sp.]|nr:hypothetical protein [Pilimelia sp.]